MKIAVVNFANEAGNYMKAQRRLKESLKKVGLDFTPYFFNNENEIHPDCPTHKEVPYAFKPYAIKRAIDDGFDIVIWADSAVFAVSQVTEFVKHIQTKGYIFFDNIGYSIGDYTSDKCLDIYGINRNESMNMKMIMACLMGLNTHSKEAMEFFSGYYEAAKNGSFIGSWSNNKGEVSRDERCKGHRHDQSAASLIINRLDLEITTGQDTYFAYTSHKGHIPIADSVCIYSEGM